MPLDTIFNTMQASLGSAYVNDFNTFGKTYQVRVQADDRFRLRPEDIGRLEVRNHKGEMIPLGTLATVHQTLGPQIVPRYNLSPAATITGAAAAGVSSGEAIALMEQLAASQLPPSMGFEWTGMAFQEKRVGSQAADVFALAVLSVYLVLAAQYQSWLMPAAVIMVVPLALLGTVAAVAARGMDNNIYTQIGIVLINALSSKNAILMTSFAFILGIVPLLNATGAGAASRRALGTAVFGGMVAATVLAVFFVPGTSFAPPASTHQARPLELRPASVEDSLNPSHPTSRRDDSCHERP